MDLRSIVHAQDAPEARKGLLQTSKANESDLPADYHDAKHLPESLVGQKSVTYLEQKASHSSYPPPIRTSSYHETFSRHEAAGAQRQTAHAQPRVQVEPVHQTGYQEGSSSSSSQGHPSFNQSNSATYTPTASSPGSASFQSSFQRPTSSHSNSTPKSAQYPPPGFPLASPTASEHYQRQSGQGTHGQSSSQPHTPLGPPSSRPTHSIKRESPVAYTNERNQFAIPNGYQSTALVSPQSSTLTQTYFMSPSQSESRRVGIKREESISVSPKTRVESLPNSNVIDAVSPNIRSPTLNRAPSEILHRSLSMGEQMRPKMRRSASITIDGLLNEVPANGHKGPSPQRSEKFSQMSPKSSRANSVLPERPDPHLIPQNTLQSPPVFTPSPSEHSNADNVTKPPPITSIESMDHDMPTAKLEQTTDQNSGFASSTQAEVNSTEPKSPSVSEFEPVRKKPRLEENGFAPNQHTTVPQKRPSSTQSDRMSVSHVGKRKPRRQPTPIFAQSVRKSNKAGPNATTNSNHGLQHAASTSVVNGHPTNLTPDSVFAHSETRDDAMASGPTLNNQTPPSQASHHHGGPLGPWEPSILNNIPSEELVKVISDWLFVEVVLREGIGVGAAGVVARQGAVLEIEAKLGRLIDRNTNDRLRLPVMTECVVSPSDPNLRLSFESSMSEFQHRALNKFLNEALVASQPAKSNRADSTQNRIPISYTHTRETDSFHELSQKGLQALPPAITAHFSPHHRNKTTVRVTNDQRTGKELARIVKARVADIDVYSPRTVFDYRISINIEMTFEGNAEQLADPDRQRARKADRNKDRVSYKHLAYQIDLTQVTPTEGQTPATEKEHELEIELSSAEVRRQGLLARDGQANRYEELVRGFVDNVRVLARHCPPVAG